MPAATDQAANTLHRHTARAREVIARSIRDAEPGSIEMTAIIYEIEGVAYSISGRSLRLARLLGVIARAGEDSEIVYLGVIPCSSQREPELVDTS